MAAKKANATLGYKRRNPRTKPLRPEVSLLLRRGPVQNVLLAKMPGPSGVPPHKRDGDSLGWVQRRAVGTTGEKGVSKKGLRELGCCGLKRRLSCQQSSGIQNAAGNRKARIALHCHTGGGEQSQTSAWEVARSPSLEHL